MNRFLLVFLLFLSWPVWSQSVRMLSLEDCINTALDNNLLVRRGYYSVRAGQLGLLQSKMALLPSLNMGGSYGRNLGRAVNPVTNSFINRNSNFVNVQAAGNMTLFGGFRLSNTIRQSARELEATNFELLKSRNDVTLNVVTLYTNVIFNKELLENARFQLQSSQEQLDRIVKQVAAGQLAMSSQLNQEAQVASNEVNLINQENALNLSLLQLKQAMQIVGSEVIDVVVPQIDAEDLILDNTPEEVYAMALQTMPEIQAASARVESARLALQAARGNFSPRLSFNAVAQSNYASISDVQRTAIDGVELGTNPIGVAAVNGVNQPVYAYQPVYRVISSGYNVQDQLSDNLFKSLSLQLSIPLFNGLQTRTGVQRAAINRELAQITRQETENTLRQSIESAYNDALAASKTYAASLKQVNARNEAYRMVKQRYEIGSSNYVEYRIAETDLFQSKSDLARAKFNFIFRKKLLDFYQGKPIKL